MRQNGRQLDTTGQPQLHGTSRHGLDLRDAPGGVPKGSSPKFRFLLETKPLTQIGEAVQFFPIPDTENDLYTSTHDPHAEYKELEPDWPLHHLCSPPDVSSHGDQISIADSLLFWLMRSGIHGQQAVKYRDALLGHGLRHDSQLLYSTVDELRELGLGRNDAQKLVNFAAALRSGSHLALSPLETDIEERGQSATRRMQGANSVPRGRRASSLPPMISLQKTRQRVSRALFSRRTTSAPASGLTES